ALFRADDGTVRRAHRPADRDLVCPGNGRPPPRPGHPERHRLFSDRARQCHCCAVPRQSQRSDRLPPGIAICLCGATLTTLPQAFTENYWVFTAERFAVGLFIGGLLPTANA